jgi:hypothetical protein
MKNQLMQIKGQLNGQKRKNLEIFNIQENNDSFDTEKEMGECWDMLDEHDADDEDMKEVSV